ncbi:10542_t:CDS:2 [Paraglomus occultum]|uniref:10542_t:CDS:1 n=1 Tax=Paraglomus occultum TaxID=144539 RepID=A0A9N9A1X6_9GLOM|nr:10542_t:CDS:2 [Paraglomus occultum]
MTKFFRLTFIALAVIALANAIVSMPLPFSESNLSKKWLPGDRVIADCHRRRQCVPYLGHHGTPPKGPTNIQPKTD